MELLSDAIKLLKPQVWMAKVELKDAFYSIPVHIDHQKFFKLEWDLKYFKFTGMPNGYCEAIRLFTKIMKVPFIQLFSLMIHFFKVIPRKNAQQMYQKQSIS